ncbi:MAG: hypothetical protein R3C59_30990 [Planctomycetaceae bacterium]
MYFKDSKTTQYFVAVCLCGFDGSELTYVKHGSELTINVKRGLYEPSVIKFGNRFYLTLRNDDHGYVTSSSDGLMYDEPRRWTFGDGSDLGNYNTQQHWVTHGDELYLVFTRKAPTTITCFVIEPHCLSLRSIPKSYTSSATERVLVPERGARLGNLWRHPVTPDETWVVATEWMQTWAESRDARRQQIRADNSIHIAKIKWKSD